MCSCVCVCVRPRGETSTNSRATQSPRSISSSLMHTSLSNSAISSLQSLLVLCPILCLISLTLYFHSCSSCTFSPHSFPCFFVLPVATHSCTTILLSAPLLPPLMSAVNQVVQIECTYFLFRHINQSLLHFLQCK